MTPNDRRSKARASDPASATPPGALAAVPLFQALDEADRRAVATASQEQTLPAGSYLFKAGEAYQQSLVLLLEGELELRRANGRVEPAAVGDLLGLSNYLDGEPYSSSALAVTDCRVLRIPAEVATGLEERSRAFGDALDRLIAQKLRDRAPDRSIRSGILARPAYSVMRSPLATCTPTTPLREALRTLQDRRIGSLVVTGEDGRLQGLVGCQGLSAPVLLGHARPEDPVTQAVVETPLTADPGTPLWQIESLMHRHQRKYVVIVEDAHPLGVISQTDILRSLVSGQSSLITQIGRAEHLEALMELARRVPRAAAEAREGNRRPSDAVRLLSEIHLAIQRRCIELALAGLERDGRGRPPAEFAFIVMGSGGRKEMLINPDQDNGIIYADVPESEAERADAWFAELAQRVNVDLDRVGYILCPGEIMARNPLYRKSLAGWRRQIDYITEHPNDKAARWSNIVFDFDTLYGNDALSAALRRHALAAIDRRPLLLRRMAEQDAEGRPAIGLFNRLITTTDEKQGGRIDIKRNGLRIVADAARIYALKSAVVSPNTIDRLLALGRQERLSQELVSTVVDAYQELLDLALGHQLAQAERGEQPDKLVDPRALGPQGRDTLRIAMRAVKRLQDRLQTDFDLSLF